MDNPDIHSILKNILSEDRKLLNTLKAEGQHRQHVESLKGRGWDHDYMQTDKNGITTSGFSMDRFDGDLNKIGRHYGVLTTKPNIFGKIDHSFVVKTA